MVTGLSANVSTFGNDCLQISIGWIISFPATLMRWGIIQVPAALTGADEKTGDTEI